ncbi:Ribulose bisphosphate carboxylase large chain [Capsicum annuum]|nr:Ribulose bisphosphate carboxylase large chain [Capsicum annuum]KAF3640787.1 Ribulose bisphosphate carboxylase large chain [Capsicum annuum]
MFTSIVGYVFRFKALHVLRLEDLGLDFTKDDENMNSQPFMHWRDCFLFCAEALCKAHTETVTDRQKNNGMHFRVLAKTLHMSGGDHIHSGTVVGHPWANAPGAVANRVALKACVKSHNEGHDLAREGNEIIRKASKSSPELAAACEVWKEIIFNFAAVEILDK